MAVNWGLTIARELNFVFDIKFHKHFVRLSLVLVFLQVFISHLSKNIKYMPVDGISK